MRSCAAGAEDLGIYPAHRVDRCLVPAGRLLEIVTAAVRGVDPFRIRPQRLGDYTADHLGVRLRMPCREPHIFV